MTKKQDKYDEFRNDWVIDEEKRRIIHQPTKLSMGVFMSYEKGNRLIFDNLKTVRKNIKDNGIPNSENKTLTDKEVEAYIDEVLTPQFVEIYEKEMPKYKEKESDNDLSFLKKKIEDKNKKKKLEDKRDNNKKEKRWKFLRKLKGKSNTE